MKQTNIGIETYYHGDEYRTRVIEEGQTIYENKGVYLSIEGMILVMKKVRSGSKLPLEDYDNYIRSMAE